MFITGLGVGPTFSVFTIVVQNAVPFRQLGVATSNLTFFRQIGGTVALAFVGHDLRHRRSRSSSPARCSPPACRQPVLGGLRRRPARGAFDLNQLTGVGDLGQVIVAAFPSVPRRGRAVHPAIVDGIHAAFSLAIAQTFWLGVVGVDRRGRRRGRHQGDPAARHQRRPGPDPVADGPRRRRPLGSASTTAATPTGPGAVGRLTGPAPRSSARPSRSSGAGGLAFGPCP